VSRSPISLDSFTSKRLEEIRGTAPWRSPSVRNLAAFSQNTDCKLAQLGFATGVDFDRILKGTRYQASFGQSPFAIQRGLAFERVLRDNNYARTIELLGALIGVDATSARVVNLREGFPAGPNENRERAQATVLLLRQIINGDPKAPHLIDGAILQANLGGREGFFEADAIAVKDVGGLIRVAEVKSFPKVDNRVDPDQLGAALDQVAVYLYLTRRFVAEMGAIPSD
jgi:hypothetical protein